MFNGNSSTNGGFNWMPLPWVHAKIQQPEAKFMVFPVLSGIQVAMTAWIKPFSKEQADPFLTFELYRKPSDRGKYWEMTFRFVGVFA